MNRQPDHQDNHPPIPVGEDTPLKMKLGTLLIIIAGVAAVVGSYLNIKWDIADHSKQLIQIQATVEAIDQKIDYMTGLRRSSTVATTTPKKKPNELRTR